MASTYMFDTAHEGEHKRLLAHALMWDPVTFRRIEGVGIGDGWHCLEVGAGGGTVTRWLTDKVGSTGRVVATDIESTWLQSLATPNLQIMQHDVTTDPLGDSRYDLINLRLVLTHLPDPARVIDTLVTALVPGGWLLIEEYDMRCLPVSHPPDATWQNVASATVELLTRSGADPSIGTTLASLLHSAGVVDIDTEAITLPRRMPQVRQSWQPQFVELRDRLIEAHLVSADDVDQVIADFDDETCDRVVYGPMLVSARGRKP